MNLNKFVIHSEVLVLSGSAGCSALTRVSDVVELTERRDNEE